MNILGIHANTHESGCALVVDGKLTHALSQERLDRDKMSAAAPVEAMEAMLAAAGLAPAEIDVLAISDDIGVAGYQRSRRLAKDSLLAETLPAAKKYYGLALWRLLRFYRRHRFGDSYASSRAREDRMEPPAVHIWCSTGLDPYMASNRTEIDAPTSKI